MILKNKYIENNTKFNSEICIIGSGMSSQILASTFKTKDIIIVESGKIEFDSKIQELNSNILIDCVRNFLFGNKKDYFLPIFHCTQESSTKSAKELFNRSLKQFYIITLGVLASLLVFTDIKNPKYSKYRNIIFLSGIACLTLSEVNSEFINKSIINNSIIILLPTILLIIMYFNIFNLSKKNL